MLSVHLHSRIRAHHGYELEPEFDSTMICCRLPNFLFYSGRIVRFDTRKLGSSHQLELWSPNCPLIPYFPGQRRPFFSPMDANGLPPPSYRCIDGSLGRFDHT